MGINQLVNIVQKWKDFLFGPFVGGAGRARSAVCGPKKNNADRRRVAALIIST